MGKPEQSDLELLIMCFMHKTLEFLQDKFGIIPSSPLSSSRNLAYMTLIELLMI